MRASLALILACAVLFHATGGQAQTALPWGVEGFSDFYRWHGPLPATPGTVLRAEPLASEQSIPEAGQALRLLYTSTDGVDGRGVVAVSGALFLPKGAPPKGGWRLVTWAHGTTGIADACAPSVMARSARDAAYLGAWLSAGYAVAATDYQGLGTPGLHPYSNYRAASYSVLDIARAAAGGRYPISRRVVVVGQSQGAGAAIAAGGYAPAYARDLDILGVVATGAPNLSREAIETGLAWSATDTMVTAAYAMIGYELTNGHPDLKAEDVFTPAGLDLARGVATTCLGDLMKDAAAHALDPPKAFRPGMLARLWNTDIALRAYPTKHLAMPMFVGIGLADSAALPETTLRLVSDMCRAGSTLVVRAYRGQDHNGAVGAATADAIRFARDLETGSVAGPICAP